MGSGSDKKPPIPAAPLFSRLGEKAGAAAKFARDLGISEQRLTNWKRRGIPPGSLPTVAAHIGVSVESYLQEAGVAPLAAHSPVADYLTEDEKEMIVLYRAATGRWKVAIKHMAKLRGDHAQDEAAESLTIILAKIAADPVSDRRVEEAYGRPPSHSKKHS